MSGRGKWAFPQGLGNAANVLTDERGPGRNVRSETSGCAWDFVDSV